MAKLGEMGTWVVRRDAVSALTLKTVRVDIVAGPDAGTSKTSAEEVFTIGTAPGNTLQVTDRTVSRYHLELRSQEDFVLLQDLGSTNGTILSGARLERARIGVGTTLYLGRTQIVVRDGEQKMVELSVANEVGGVRGNTVIMRRLLALVAKAAKSEVPVLITGESGTGKELIARAVHDTSSRADKPFVVVDCGSLSPTLIGSELFGHEKGAFTGATDRHAGAFEQAGDGTVFLDEIGELPPASQANLLGVLERGTFRRLGGQKELPLRARVLSATNRDLRSDVNRGNFRLDLFYRLAIVVLHTPALREHPDDIPLLIEHFLQRGGYSGTVEELFPPAVMERFRAHTWPGNVRELRNTVDAARTLGPDWSVTGTFAAIPPAGAEVLENFQEPTSDSINLGVVNLSSELQPYNEARSHVLASFEKIYLRQLYDRCEGNVSKAARHAQMDRSYLISLLRKHNIRG